MERCQVWKFMCVHRNNQVQMIVQRITCLVFQEISRIKTLFALNKTKHMEHINFYHLQVLTKNMGQSLWYMDHPPHRCGGIDNDKVNLGPWLLTCFNYIFFMFNLNMPCWTSKSQLEIITWIVGANFPFLGLSTWAHGL
jgi:hypothetical protein